MAKDIIKEIEGYNLLGRSGSCFPAALKWQAVKKSKADKKYIICNGSEGDPKNFKDGFILKNHPETVVQGIKTALKTIDNSFAFIYLRKDYYKEFARKLRKLSRGFLIKIVEKKNGYLGGEETVVCQAIEGKRPEPKAKPPFPSSRGLWGYPTLINNVETFYCVGKISQGKYKKTRFYGITGDVRNKGVYELAEDYNIRQILEKTDNYPDFDFFVQSGGGASGEILLEKELKKQVQGIGCLVVFNAKKTDPFALMKEWADFFLAENCDKCTPCREGVYRISEIIRKKKIDKKTLNDIFLVLEKTSFCPLGKNVCLPFKTLIKKVIKQ